MQVDIAIAKANKHTMSVGGDSAEIVERPLGGVTGVVVDGQGSGHSAKLTSNMIVGKISTLLADGARDGAIARAVQDYLYTIKGGKVSATLNMISVASDTKSLVISRSGHCPIYMLCDGKEYSYAKKTKPLGFYKFSKPQIVELPLKTGTKLLTFSDGILSAGRKYGKTITEADILSLMQQELSAYDIANQLIDQAIELDKGRPSDDTTVMAINIGDSKKNIRRLSASYPL
ncbi:PP2C family protein-serine/threonine phosphatase [Proteinivorax hydrogeniformans]|uniref:PP2C family protein-serine/threonine phosphatase n=1 Tax=Proteinivorax hydrogeniformans TaxID=1826727 RepID=A0AAU8HR70_9FIRM